MANTVTGRRSKYIKRTFDFWFQEKQNSACAENCMSILHGEEFHEQERIAKLRSWQ
jgi:hypothetical protein